MALGLTRREQWALLGVVGLILAGLGVQGWRAGQGSGVAASETIYVAGQGHWQKPADFKDGEKPQPLLEDSGTTKPRTTAGGSTSSTTPTGESTAKPVTGPAPLRNALLESTTTLASYSLTPAAPVPAARQKTGGMDINQATAAEFERLPGIGPAKARAIVETRERLGGFATIDQLDAVPGIGPKTLDRLRPYLRLDAPGRGLELVANTAPATQTLLSTATINLSKASAALHVNVNTADQRQLEALPGIGPAMAGRIIAERNLRRFSCVEDLRRVKGIGPKTWAKLAPLVVTE